MTEMHNHRVAICRNDTGEPRLLSLVIFGRSKNLRLLKASSPV